MIHFLLEHGADSSLAEEQPLLLTAVRYCGPEVVALFAGQATQLSPKQEERAFQEVRWGKRPVPVYRGYSSTAQHRVLVIPEEHWEKALKLLYAEKFDWSRLVYDITYASIGAAVVEDFYDKNVAFLRFCFDKELLKKTSGPAGAYPADGLSQAGPDKSGQISISQTAA